MRAWLVVAIAACGSTPPPVAPVPPPAPLPPHDNRAVAEPWTPPPPPAADPVPIGDGRLLVTNPDVRVIRRQLGPPEELSHKHSDFWAPCVREVVQGRDRAVRDALGDALTAFETTCDRTAQRATFSPPRRGYANGSYVAFAGVVTPTTLQLELVFVHRGTAPLVRISIVAGATSWTSPAIDQVTTLPYTRTLARIVAEAIETNDAIVRFETAETSEDVAITDEMKRDLAGFVEIFDALNP